MQKLTFILLATFTIIDSTRASCPPNPKEWSIVIDSCASPAANKIENNSEKLKKLCESKTQSIQKHPSRVIDTYRASGGKDKIWLFPYLSAPSHKQINFFSFAVHSAIRCKIDYILFSGGGYASFSKSELNLIKKFISLGGKYIAAAGNDSLNIDKFPFYPASYPGVIAVGAIVCDLKSGLVKESFSNYGKKINMWACGMAASTDVFLSCKSKNILLNTCGKSLAVQGTSFSAPRALAYLQTKDFKRKKNE